MRKALPPCQTSAWAISVGVVEVEDVGGAELSSASGTYFLRSSVQILLSNKVQQVRGGIQNIISTEGFELFASQVTGEHTDAGDASGLGGTDIGLGVTGADDGRLLGHTELVHDSQDLVGFGAAMLDFVTSDNGVDDSVAPAHGGDNDVDDFARKARRQADFDALVVQCFQHVFDAWQWGRRVFLVRASNPGVEGFSRSG